RNRLTRLALGPRPLVVPHLANPTNWRAARSDRLRRFLRTRRRGEPRRARHARNERESNERRAPPCLSRARKHEPPQERVPREHVARAADTAQRNHRLLTGTARKDVRGDQREATGVPRGHPLLR